jgi:hypothetical protein
MTTEKKQFKMRSGQGGRGLLKHELGPVNILEQFEKGTNLDEIPATYIEDESEAMEILRYRLDVKIQEVQEKLILNTSSNRQWCYDNDNLSQLVSHSISRLMIGDGIAINAENDEVEDYINNWNKNVRKTPSIYSIDGLIRDIITDNLCHGESLYIKRKVKINELDQMVFPGTTKKDKNKDDIQETISLHRIDMRTVRTIEHDFIGIRKWLQYAYIPAEMIAEENRTAKFFYSENYKPGGIGMPDYYYNTTVRSSIHTTQILDTEAVHFNLFTTPPIVPVMQEIVYKVWINWAMRVAAERTAIPERWARVGTELDHPPDDEYEEVLQNALELLQMSRGGDVHAIPYNWEFGHIDMSGSKMDFVSELNYLNEQIVLGLGSHMALYQASGSDLATSTVIEDMLIRAVIGMRKEIGNILSIFYTELLITVGFDMEDEKNQFDILWSPLKADAYADYVRVIIDLAQTEINGKPIIKNRNEARKMLESFLKLEPLDDDEEKEGETDDFPVEDTDTPPESDFNPLNPDEEKEPTEDKPDEKK